MLKLVENVRKHKNAIHVLVGVNVVTTVSSTRFGWIWWLLNPLITMFIYYFFVGVLLDRGGDNYHLFVLTGIVAWQMFAVSITGSMSSISSNKQLIKQVALPIEVLIIVPILVQLFFGIIGIAIVMVLSFGVIGLHTLACFILLLYISMAGYAIGLFLSIVSMYFKDTKQIIAYMLRAGFFLSPILFPVTRITSNERIPHWITILLQLNPMAHIIPQLRSILLHGHVLNWGQIVILGVILLLCIQLGLLWVRRNATLIIKML